MTIPTVFTKNRDRLMSTQMLRKIMAAILAHREVAPLLSDEHFSVDGTLVKGEPPKAPPVRARWRTASMKSFQPKGTPPEADGPGDGPGGDDPVDPPSQDPASDTPTTEAEPDTRTDPMPRTFRQNRNAEVDFRGEKRSNATHASVTDPDARLYKKSPGTGAMLCFMGHALMENRSGLIVQGELTQADGHAERQAALDMIHRHSPGLTRRLTLGADKGYDAAGFVHDLREACITPHVGQKARHSAIDRRTTRHDGYDLSLRHRKRIEEAFGWAKTIAGMAQTVYRGLDHVRALHLDDGRQQPRQTTPVAHRTSPKTNGTADPQASKPAKTENPSLTPTKSAPC